MKTKKTLKKKNSDYYEDSTPRPGLRSTGKKEKSTKKRLSIYDEFDDTDEYSVKSPHY